jgi:hypothetical protein
MGGYIYAATVLWSVERGDDAFVFLSRNDWSWDGNYVDYLVLAIGSTNEGLALLRKRELKGLSGFDRERAECGLRSTG